MNFQAIQDELDAALRSLRLAQRQMSIVKRQLLAMSEPQQAAYESIETMLDLLLQKVEALKEL